MGQTERLKKNELKNKSTSMISPVQFHGRDGSPGIAGVLRWEEFVEKV